MAASTPAPAPQPQQHHPLPRSPAPWSVLAESYFLPLSLAKLPPTLYAPLEAPWSSSTLGTFTGGAGAILLVRYISTPVGPYDELMLIPGNFTVPPPSGSPSNSHSTALSTIPKKALRISRIYVSQRTTAYNGRLNWNIPKHLARFSFSAPVTLPGAAPPQSVTVKVFAPHTRDGDGTPPFFACKITPWKWIPAMPLNLKYLPVSMWHVQPPLPEGPDFRRAVAEELASGVKVDEYDIGEGKEAAVEVGSERWCAFDIEGRVSRARGCWIEMLGSGEEGNTAGAAAGGGDATQESEKERYFPQSLKPWSFGAWTEEARLFLQEPIVWKL